MNTASIDELYQHLSKCDNNFEPSLSSRVDLNEFSEKIYKLSKNFEAWEGGILVGHLGCYFNDIIKRKGFINNVSILSSHYNKGIGTDLVKKCLDYGNVIKFNVIELEVYKENRIAIKLYEKFGFIPFDVNVDFIKMEKVLRSKEYYE